MKKRVGKLVTCMVLCILVVGATCLSAFANTAAPSAYSIPNASSVLYWDARTDVRPGYNAYQGQAYVACTDLSVIAVEVNGVKVDGRETYVYISGYELDTNPYETLDITFYFLEGSSSTSVSFNVYNYMSKQITPYPYPPVNLPDISDVLYWDARTDVRPGYNAYQGRAYVACTDPDVLAVEVNGTRVNDREIYVDISGYELDTNPYATLNITFYFAEGSISTTVSFNVYNYMGSPYSFSI